MFKRLLFWLGLRKAPTPIKSYVAFSSVFGTLPALAYVAWKNRDRIAPYVKRFTAAKSRPTSQTASAF